MAKLYKVRKKCHLCGKVFFPKYAGSLYCVKCKDTKIVKNNQDKKKKTSKKRKKK